MTTAFLFPGQGVDVRAVLRSWCEYSVHVRDLMDAAAQSTGVPFARLAAGGDHRLTRTEVVQPVLTALVLGIHAELVALGVQPTMLAGHSLGEVAACAASGCITAADAVALAALRGRLMARESALHPGRMLALSTSDRQLVDSALVVGRERGYAEVAAHNAPDEWVLSGDVEAIRAIAGRYSATPLPVAGAWHSAAMAGAVLEFRDAVQAALSGPIGRPLVSNHTGRVVREAGELPGLLARQLVCPVQWVTTLATLVQSGMHEAIAIGPAKALGTLARRCAGDALRVRLVQEPVDLDALVATSRA